MPNSVSNTIDIVDSSGQIEPSHASPSSSRPPSSPESDEAAKIAPKARNSRESQVLTQAEVDYKPWKYIGYQGYAKLLASDTDFLVSRRFGVTSTRILLRLQDRVVILEQNLERLDRRLRVREAEDVHNGSFRQDDQDREKLLDELQVALSEYNAFLLQQGELRKYATAAPQAIQSLCNWHANNNGPIAAEEREYLSQKHDLISLVQKVKSPLERLLERYAFFKLHWFWTDKDAPELPFYDRDQVKLFSDNKVDRFITVVITAVGTVMLIVPLWVLPNLEGLNAKLGTITAFVVLFLGMVTYTTVAKPFESLAAAAAYAAVLTVFLQLGAIGSS